MYFYAVFLLDSPLTFRTVVGGELPDFGVGIGMSGQVARFSAGEKGFVGGGDGWWKKKGEICIFACM
jgi:hypothetical protein